MQPTFEIALLRVGLGVLFFAPKSRFMVNSGWCFIFGRSDVDKDYGSFVGSGLGEQYHR